MEFDAATSLGRVELRSADRLWPYLTLADFAHISALAHAGALPVPRVKAAIEDVCYLHKTSLDRLQASCGDLFDNRKLLLKERGRDSGWMSFGRARREAITVAFHLCVRDEFIQAQLGLSGLVQTLVEVAERHLKSLFPDFTYLIPSQPSTFAHFLGGHAGPLARCLERGEELYARLNLCPAGLGSTNGSRVSLSREFLSEFLAFSAPVSHTRDAVWRSDLIVEVGAWLAALALNLVRFANDLLVFASPDFGLIKFPPQLTRVSRVLPQKNNPYPLSMLRGLGATLAALPNSLIMLHLTPTGQVDHRVHSQGELIDGLAKGRDALELARKIVQSLTLNRQAAEAHCRRHFIQSMDVAEDLALKGMDYEAAWQCLRDCMSAEGEFDEEFAHRVSRACARQGLNVSVKDILAAADPLGAVEAKQQTGACSSQAMIKQLRDLSLECARRQSTIEVRARAIRDVLRERYVSLQIEV